MLTLSCVEEAGEGCQYVRPSVLRAPGGVPAWSAAPALNKLTFSPIIWPMAGMELLLSSEWQAVYRGAYIACVVSGWHKVDVSFFGDLLVIATAVEAERMAVEMIHMPSRVLPRQ